MRYLKPLLVACATVAIAPAAYAGAIIDNGFGIQLGVDDEGQLNIGGGSASVAGLTTVGLRHLTAAGEFEATANGCLCEGWGAAAGAVGGQANNASGVSVTGVSFASGGAAHTDAQSVGSTATSVADVGTTLRVTHEYAPSASNNLYQVHVRIENISGADIANLLYRRTFDWDVDPTAFSEYSTIGGTAAATAVTGSNDNGFCSSNPLAGCSAIFAANVGDFVDGGPGDIGANFNFDFGALAAGGIFEFDIFYGAAFTEAEAFAALTLVEAEVFSFGQSIRDKTGGNGSTFIFAFKGVGGVVIGTPEPAMLGLFGLGLVGLGAARRRRKA